MLENIHQLIARDELAEALAQLRQLLEHSPKLDEVLLQSGRFSDIRKQIRLGLVSHAEANLTQNQIRVSLLDLLREMDEQAKTPALREEMERAVSVTNSKNVVLGSTISAGGNVQVGDRVTNNYNLSSKNPDNMEKQKSPILLTVIIASLGVAIGFLGELMPDKFKEKVENWATSSLGISYTTIWVSITAIVVIVFIWLVWKEAIGNPQNGTTEQSVTKRKVRQGKKSVYIEKNEGPINIK